MHRFLLAGNEECNTPSSSPIGYVFVDAVMNSVHSKDDQELSQIPYEDQLSDASITSTSTPVSQSGTSLSSEYSSGYCSDNSYGGGSRSVSLKTNQLPCPMY